MRYAIYFTPPADDPLTRRASQWLGRDAFSGETFAQPAVEGFSPSEFANLTDDPRRYGFHATMKAPFSLREGTAETDMIAALDAFAAKSTAFTLPKLVLGQLGRFFALVPGALSDDLQALAADCVRDFEPFRAPLSDSDIQRRNPQSLSGSQRSNLIDWGYPYVFEEFRFHMTLTGQVEPVQQPAMIDAIRSFFGDLIDAPRPIGHLALFVEPERGAPFVMKHIVPLAEPAIRKTA